MNIFGNRSMEESLSTVEYVLTCLPSAVCNHAVYL